MNVSLHGDIERDSFTVSVSFTVDPGETVGITGEIGSGKSTVLYALAGRVPVTEGQLALPAPSTLTLMGQLFQADLVEDLSGVENVVAAMTRISPGTRADSAAEVSARQLLSDLGVEPHVVDRLPWTFSGAEAQRVALACALAPRPQMVLLDEPTSALDKRLRAHVSEFLERWLADFDGMAVVASSNVELLTRLADRVVTVAGVSQQVGQ